MLPVFLEILGVPKGAPTTFTFALSMTYFMVFNLWVSLKLNIAIITTMKVRKRVPIVRITGVVTYSDKKVVRAVIRILSEIIRGKHSLTSSIRRARFDCFITICLLLFSCVLKLYHFTNYGIIR